MKCPICTIIPMVSDFNKDTRLKSYSTGNCDCAITYFIFNEAGEMIHYLYYAIGTEFYSTRQSEGKELLRTGYSFIDTKGVHQEIKLPIFIEIPKRPTLTDIHNAMKRLHKLKGFE